MKYLKQYRYFKTKSIDCPYCHSQGARITIKIGSSNDFYWDCSLCGKKGGVDQ